MRLNRHSVAPVIALFVGAAVGSAATSHAVSSSCADVLSCIADAQSALSRAQTFGTPTTTTVPGSTTTTTTAPTTTTTSPGAPGSSSHGTFLVGCAVDHSANDDPIVFPGLPGASHTHAFEGARGVDAFSTVNGLTAANSTTCADTADTAAYWHPTLLTGCPSNTDPMPMVDCTRTVPVERFAAYYTGFSGTSNYPAGYTVKWGNPNATAPQGNAIESWGCGTFSSIPQVDTLPNCNGIATNTGNPSHLEAHIKFPDCWDGNISPSGRYDLTDPLTGNPYVAMDGSSGNSDIEHGNGTCPAGYPKHIPALTLAVFWTCSSGCPDPAHTMLSSGSPYGFHGDYMDSWQPGALEALTDRCIRAQTDCGVVTR